MFAVLAAAVLVGSISQWIARDLVKDNMEQLQLPALLKQIGNQVDREASVMLTVAHGVASDPNILAWSDAGANADGERKLINYLNDLVRFNDLTVASSNLFSPLLPPLWRHQWWTSVYFCIF